VFEDIAIAAWLVALWEIERGSTAIDLSVGSESEETEVAAQVERKEGAERVSSMKKQTFVDLGCGNGLLTHILNEEGHKGTGIDIVSRKVWGAYGPNTELKGRLSMHLLLLLLLLLLIYFVFAVTKLLEGN
jgi:SAM-dependent methyltransferase